MGALEQVVKEYTSATSKHGVFVSAHEGFAILLEEVDELWKEVKKNPSKHPARKLDMRDEAVQVAAMALRFLVDVCGETL